MKVVLEKIKTDQFLKWEENNKRPNMKATYTSQLKKKKEKHHRLTLIFTSAVSNTAHCFRLMFLESD